VSAPPPPRSARLLRAIAIVCTVLGLSLLLLCGGVIPGPAQAIAGVYCSALPELAAPLTSPEDAAITDAHIDRCSAQVEAGTATLEEVAVYTTELSAAAADGSLDEAEQLVLARVADDMADR
jgi:hypothetical protein